MFKIGRVGEGLGVHVQSRPQSSPADHARTISALPLDDIIGCLSGEAPPRLSYGELADALGISPGETGSLVLQGAEASGRRLQSLLDEIE